jgi:hypothetical protein
MKEASGGVQGRGLERARTVRCIRDALGRTQAELAALLGVSPKAVQVQLLVLLALYRRQTMDDVPCWEVRRCPAATRERCSAFVIGRGQFCWFIGSKECAPEVSGAGAEGLPCLQCAVVRRLLRGPAQLATGTEPGAGE